MLIWVIKITLLIYAGFGVYLYFAQRSFMYFPTPQREVTEAQSELLHSGGETLKLWVVSPGKSHAVIYLGGNAEDVSANIYDLRHALPDRTVYLMNYRGYAGSTGSPTQEGLFEDALSLFDAIAGRHESVAVIGRSLGSGVATYLASRRPVAKLILVTPFDSSLALAQRYYPVYPMSLMLKDKYPSDSFAPKVQANALLLAGEHDNLVPTAHTQRLLDAFPQGRASLTLLPNAGHNDISGYSDYWRAISQFLAMGS
ncbi:alpha/beta hydrolase [Thiosocius teredinicola]|uniref:alpha/beta hydrolase n=1 Tax=Thiosocius teredinicola TaxID=1973002 RepID=UPI0009910C45